MILFPHGFPLGLAPQSPDTDLLVDSHGMQLLSAQGITTPTLILQLRLWLLVCIRETQNLAYSGHLDTQSGLPKEIHAQRLSNVLSYSSQHEEHH